MQQLAPVDLVVIGGGINGAGIALDAAGRGLSVMLPHSPEQRPAWMVRFGLFLYDHLGGHKKLPSCRHIDLQRDPEGEPIKDNYTRAFEYSDCWVDDARLVVLNALDALERGAKVMTRTAATSARRHGAGWEVEFKTAFGLNLQVRSRVLINAAGPWAEDVIGRVAGGQFRAAGAFGQGQSHHRAEVLEGATGLSVPEP